MKEIKKNWNLIKFICQECGKEIYAFPSRNRKFCAGCVNRKREKKCIYCGKLFKSSESRKQKFCCYKCAMLFRTGKSRPLSVVEKMKATKWEKPSKTFDGARKRAIYMIPNPEKCERCGSNEKLHRHHKDRNVFNTVRENLEILCSKCHRKEHLKNKENYAYLYT